MLLAGTWNASLAIQEIARFGLCIGRHVLLGYKRNRMVDTCFHAQAHRMGCLGVQPG
jgi:hypothetical protein